MLTPIEFGLPRKFSSWRSGQLDAIDFILDDSRRFKAVCAPTGFGKSLMYEAAARMSGLRTVVLTSTKGLQDQLQADFGGMEGMIDLRGQSNYPCKLAPTLLMPAYTTVEMGPCHSGLVCELKSSGMPEGCEYFARYGIAKKADIVHTNYAMWMYDGLKEDNLNSTKPVEMLVLDEAHDAVECLAGFIGEELKYTDCQKAKITFMRYEDYGDDQEKWREWAREQADVLNERLEAHARRMKLGQVDKKGMREAQEWKRTGRKLEKIAAMKGEWCIEGVKDWDNGASVRFDPLWPAPYAESALFRGVKKVVLVSATVRPKTLALLGIPPQEADFREFPSSFPVTSRPVIHVPTVQMNYKNEQDDFKVMKWMNTIDRIAEARGDKKGVIHTVSYSRAQLLKDNLRSASRLVSHSSKDRAEVVGEWKQSKASTILASPSVDTGYDFPYQECEWQIIAKIPFLNVSAKIVKLRQKLDKEYGDYTTAQTLVQMTGRGMRAADDRCETLIPDDNLVWFIKQARAFLPQWWLDSVQLYVDNPIPLEKLRK